MKKLGKGENGTKKGDSGSGAARPARPPLSVAKKPKPLTPSERKVVENQIPITFPPSVPKEARGPMRQAYDLAVVDKVTMQQAADLIGVLKALVSKIEDDYEPQLKAAQDTIKKIRKARDDKTNPLNVAIDLLREKNHECEDRLKAIARKAIDEANKVAKQKETLERRKLAADLVLEGKDDEARRLLQAPSDVAEIKPAPISLNGRTQQMRWRWELKDIRKVNPDYLTTNDGAITGLVRGMGQADGTRRKEIQLLLGDGIELIEYPVDSYSTAEEAEEAEA
jgi:hypothetical protein